MSDFYEENLSFAEIKEKTDQFCLNLNQRAPLAFRFGQGHLLYDTEGKQFIDFLCGISVTNLGHGEADIIEAIRDQLERLVHSSNLFYQEHQARLAEVIINYSFPGQVFFSNSGAESNEAAFKLMRSFGQQAKGGAERIISLEGSFHGRTVGGMCLTAQEKIHKGFGKLLDGHSYLPLNDIDLLEREFEEHGDATCGFIMELIQGEGGIRVADQDYVKRVRELCDEYDVLLVLDEIQTGMGRTGQLFCYEHYDIQPDAMSLSKALGNGFPIGALVVGEKHVPYLKAGQHGSTFSGNHVASTAAYEVFRILYSRDIFKNVDVLSEFFFKRLRVLEKQYDLIKEVRGIGLHIGMELNDKGPQLVELAREKGLLVNCTAGNTIRIMPPLIIDIEQAAQGLEILESCVQHLS